ncbi:CHAD domain-containing protein [Gluconacetobacter takamatsuzukensis]|uniref:CHAD domain-containing protein n=1 Tax=Gluconacetobacter takamatsuzukensis TaxID=1286190 RepID=A0A7W4KG41_9PROT|nr:CHAD domain-containing protein [Gluconacetobacter takamatsuzukensis]
MRRAVVRIARVLRDHLEANLPVAMDGRNVEGVHQVRVALRRFRALLGLLRRDYPSATLDEAAARARLLARTVGEARDWDVFLLETLPGLSPLGRAGINVAGLLLPRANPLRDAAYDRVGQVLGGADAEWTLHLTDRLAEGALWDEARSPAGLKALEEPAADFAARHLARLHRKARRMGRGFAHLTPPERHQVRLALKKLRYASEFFVTLHAPGQAGKPYLRRLAAAQAALGMDSDVLTTGRLLERFGGETGGEMRHAVGAVTGFLCCRQDATHEAAHRHWRKFRRTPVFWEA